MPWYRCISVDARGRKRVTERLASSEKEAARSFAVGELFFLSAEPSDGRPRGPETPATADMVREFTDMTALLLDSGMGFREVLGIEAEIVDGRLGPMIREFLEEIDRGDSFSEILDRRSGSFPPLYRGMVRVGERVGSLKAIFPLVASWLDDRKTFRDKLAGALSYPAIVLTAALLGSAGVAFFLLPRLQELFLEFGGRDAGIIRDRVRLAVGFFSGIAAVLTLATAAGFGFFAIRKKGGQAARILDGVALSLPVVGRFAMNREILNFAAAMEILALGQVPLETALEEAASASDNAAFRSAILAAREDLSKGRSLSAALGARKEIPSYLSRWMRAGERSGQTARVFAQVRRYFQAEMDRCVFRLTTLLEPALIILVGGVVLFLVVSFVLPFFSLYESFP